jgi:hypothetical protein
MVNKIGLEVHDHPHPYRLGCINNDVKLKVEKCKIKFGIGKNYIDEVEVDAIPLNVCGLVFVIPYMYMRDAIFMRENKMLPPLTYG